MLSLFRKRPQGDRALRRFPGSGTFAHGVHPPQRKEMSADAPIEIVPAPEKVILPLQQHIGGPCTPLVKARQKVTFGEMVGKGEAHVSASLHAPVNGVVQKEAMATLANGRHMPAIVIKAEGEQLAGQALWDQLYGGPWPQKSYQVLAPDKISAAIHDAGIVGLGGGRPFLPM